jgi:formylglycine-generating enzyme required for sulfatase activity
MSPPVVVLEAIGQALLPLLAAPGPSVDTRRLARDVWGSLSEDRALDTLAALDPAGTPAAVAEAVRRLLPGQQEAIHLSLSRYLGVLPTLLRRGGSLKSDNAEALLRWLPPRLPAFQAGDRPPGVGDRTLVEPVRVTAEAECWLATNPHLPDHPAVVLAFFGSRDEAQRLLGPSKAGIEHTFLDGEHPCLQFASVEAMNAWLGGEAEKSSRAAPPAPEPPHTRPRPRKGADVWKVLDALQKAEPERPKLLTNSVGMRFVLVPATTFRMGSPPDEPGRRDNEGPVHDVILTKAFYLGVTPVTQEQYQRAMGTNPARFQGAAGGGPEHPVECVSWEDVLLFCRRLGERPEEAQEGRSYRLPTEAEWECACRAGSATPFHFGDSLSPREASFDGNHPYGEVPRAPTPPRTVPVGSFPANYYGLHDMHGNVWEWCSDWYDAGYYSRSPRQDPQGPESGVYRVLRGGSWRNQAATCRSAYRNALAPNQRQPFIGFRVVLMWAPPAEV